MDSRAEEAAAGGWTSPEAGERLTPVRRQYLALKQQYPDAILFFRLGDFYETFDTDAELTARLLNITLTSREMGKGKRVPLAGVPYHAAETYIARLIAAGQKVAVCEQLDEQGGTTTIGQPPPGHGLPAGHGSKAVSKKMMAREVVRVVTPGTVVEPRMLQAQRNNYLCALVAAYQANGLPAYGLAYADLTTGEFATTELHGDEAAAELARELERLQPAECVVPGIGAQPRPPGAAGAGGTGPERDGERAAGGDRQAVVPAPAAGIGVAEEAAVHGRSVARLDPWRFELETAQEGLCRLFGVASLAGYGCAHLPLATRAAGALVAYVEGTHRQLLTLLDGLRTYEPGAFVRLDGFTRRNLELHEDRGRGAAGEARPTLYSVLDVTQTPMGGRLLRRWLGQPLRSVDELNLRLDAVGAFYGDGVLRGTLRGTLARVADLERLTSRVRQTIAQPRDLLALRTSLIAAAEIRTLAPGSGMKSAGDGVNGKGRAVALQQNSGPGGGGEEPTTVDALGELLARVDPCADVAELIERAVYDPAADAAGGGQGGTGRLGSWEEERLLKGGYSAELDELVRSSADARQWIAGLEALERERTGIKGLKVGFNKVFGYYLHVSHAYKGDVPGHYIRRQTLTDGERYITPELKEYENTVLHAAERITELERQLFFALQRQIATRADALLGTAAALARLDALASFAEVAVRRGYVRPVLDECGAIDIREGRHPVVEHALESATAQLGQPAAFVPNDCALDASGVESGQILILTGPNMAGKSTTLRAVALIVLMAQSGCFVPAQAARIGLVDRIFTRVGAQDDLAAGQSTFMVEMVETASILRHATDKSLVILDEIGRGTSTYDGVAIAQAVVEYLHDTTVDARRTTHDPASPAGGEGSSVGVERLGAGPRTLFATHYHELAELERALPRVRNFRMDVLEEGDRVVFLHRVVAGSADRSYGIHVARLAGVPRAVTARAQEILAGLEASRLGIGDGAPVANGTHAIEGGPTSNGHTRSDENPAAGQHNGHRGGAGNNGTDANNGRLDPKKLGQIRVAARGEAQITEGAAFQLSLFAPEHPLVAELRALDVLSLTPLQALNTLAELVERAKR
ncbi:MAG: DNA mismatch repair protein MutS [uncultured Chloroflexi bacterium]|uniref:DNA mismatch repair protein MutS n=1 Tax=uncultured Chloroflexota bacterium TaxID=166587 RepID=A0A6J4HH63_9CHLR|nr:MAG: DNA mismatch repair protein MutS [uncultured Chloroflexota bacterium]